MKRLGVTGTRMGWTKKQQAAFMDFALDYQPDEFRHGDCVGGDQEAHEIVRQYLPNCLIIIHPPVDEEHRAFCAGDELLPPKTHFARNRDIVDQCDVLFVGPLTNEWQPRGGTWYTNDYAKKRGKRRVIAYPDGRIEDSTSPSHKQGT